MNTTTHKILFICTLFAGMLLSGLCIVLPVIQWASLANNVVVKIVIGCAALGLGICKLTFFPMCALHLQRKSWFPGAVLLFMASIALVISTFATASLVENLIQQKKHTATTQNVDYQLQLNGINALDDQINNLNTLITNDINNNYRARALKQQASVNMLNSERNSLLTTLRNKENNSDTATKTGLGGQWQINFNGKIVVLKGSLVAALALHITGVFALLSVSAWWPIVKKVDSNNEDIEEESKSSELENDMGEKIKIFTPSEFLTDDQNELANKISRGDFSQSPVIRNIVADKETGIKGGYKRVKPVFDYLLNAGVLQQQGRGYVLR